MSTEDRTCGGKQMQEVFDARGKFAGCLSACAGKNARITPQFHKKHAGFSKEAYTLPWACMAFVHDGQPNTGRVGPSTAMEFS